MRENFEQNQNSEENIPIEESFQKLEEKAEEAEMETHKMYTFQFKLAQKMFPGQGLPNDKFNKYIEADYSKDFRWLWENDSELKKKIIDGEEDVNEVIEKIKEIHAKNTN